VGGKTPGVKRSPQFPSRNSCAERGRLRCHKRPKSREETPKEGSDSNGLPHILSKTIAISGSSHLNGSRTDTKAYGAYPNDQECRAR